MLPQNFKKNWKKESIFKKYLQSRYNFILKNLNETTLPSKKR